MGGPVRYCINGSQTSVEICKIKCGTLPEKLVEVIVYATMEKYFSTCVKFIALACIHIIQNEI